MRSCFYFVTKNLNSVGKYAMTIALLFNGLQYGISQVVVNSNSSTSALNTTRTGALFLLISPDSRTSGMNNVGIATNPDITSAYYCSAKLPFISNDYSANVSYTPWFRSVNAGMYLFAASAYAKIGRDLGVSFSTRYFRYGDNNILDPTTSKLLTYVPYEMSADISLGYKLLKGVGIGLSGRWLTSNIAYNGLKTLSAASTFLVDLSFFSESNLNYKYYNKQNKTKRAYNLGYDKMYFGAAIANMGGRLVYDKAKNLGELPPTKLTLGLGIKKVINELNIATVSIEAIKLLAPAYSNDAKQNEELYKKSVMEMWMSGLANFSSGLTVNIGAEYWYNDLIAFRTGWGKALQANGIETISIGMSVRPIEYVSIDVSYLLPLSESVKTFNPLSNTFRFGLSAYFN